MEVNPLAAGGGQSNTTVRNLDRHNAGFILTATDSTTRTNSTQGFEANDAERLSRFANRAGICSGRFFPLNVDHDADRCCCRKF
jgi:hypothetical protein